MLRLKTMNANGAFQVLGALIAFPDANENERQVIGEKIGDIWMNRFGAVGMLHQIRSECLVQPIEPGGDTIKVLRFYSSEDIFNDGDAGHVQQVIAVGRNMGWGVERRGGWFELQEDGGTPMKVEEEKWYEITHVIETIHTVAGTLYFDLHEEDWPGERCGNASVNTAADRIDAGEVNRCFDEVGRLIVESFENKKSMVIGLAGVCGCGKSTELARVIRKHAPKVTRFVVEPRRRVAVNNARWMQKGKREFALKKWVSEGREEKQFTWPREDEEYARLVDLHVGVLYAPPPEDMIVVSKKDVEIELLRVKTQGSEDGRTIYLTTGTLSNLATTFVRLQSKVVKGKPVVCIVSDWEDKTMEVAQGIVDFKRMCKRLECTFVIVMASQAHLVDPWLAWVRRDLEFVQKYAPASLAKYYTDPERKFSRQRFDLHLPNTLNGLGKWEETIMKLTKSVCWGLLRRGGCLIVKVVGKKHCFHLAQEFKEYEDSLIAAGILLQEDRIDSIPFCSSLVSLPRLGTKPGILFCTDVVMYGHNLPHCRAVISCGLRKMLQFNKSFGIVMLNTHMMSWEEIFQLCGRIDRLKILRGHAFSLLPSRAQVRPRCNDLMVTYDDLFILMQLEDLIKKAKNFGEVQKIGAEELAQFGISSQMGYAFALFKINYCIPVEGPSNFVDLGEYMELLTKKLSPAPTRWKVILLQLWLLQMNKANATRAQALPEFERLLVMVLTYIAFTEEGYVWMYSIDEAKWADQVMGGGGTHFVDIVQEIGNAKDRFDHTLDNKYGGKGYQRMNFLSKLFSISLAPVKTEVRYCGRPKWSRVMPPYLAKLKLMEIKNLLGPFVDVNLGFKAVCRNHFRLLSEDRWEEAGAGIQIQLVLCNTRPLQVAKFIVSQGKTPHYALTLVTKQVVYFDDSKLCWNDDVKGLGSQCRCGKARKMRTRYIYFGVVGKTKVTTKRGDLFQICETMAIAHKIGCGLEEWCLRTGANVGPSLVVMDITRVRNNSAGIRVDLVKQALENSFEEKN